MIYGDLILFSSPPLAVYIFDSIILSKSDDDGVMDTIILEDDTIWTKGLIAAISGVSLIAVVTLLLATTYIRRQRSHSFSKDANSFVSGFCMDDISSEKSVVISDQCRSIYPSDTRSDVRSDVMSDVRSDVLMRSSSNTGTVANRSGTYLQGNFDIEKQSDMSSLWDTASQLLDAQHFENVEALKANQRDSTSLRDKTNHLNCSIDDFKCKEKDSPPLNEIEAGVNVDPYRSDDNDDSIGKGEEECDLRVHRDISHQYTGRNISHQKDRSRSKSRCSVRTGISTRTEKVDNRKGIQVWQNKELVRADSLAKLQHSLKPATSLEDETALACLPHVLETFGSPSKHPVLKKKKHNSICGVRL